MSVENPGNGIWTEPKLPFGSTPFRIYLEEDEYTDNPYAVSKDWDQLTPDQQSPFLIRSQAAFERYNTELCAFNAAVPLSPLVDLPAPSPVTSPYQSPVWTPPEETLRHKELVRRRGLQIWNRYRRDHPQACGGHIAPTPDMPLRFLDLPPELRDMIYRLLLPQSKTVIQMDLNGSAKTIDRASGEGPIDMRLFAVCKLVYEEATHVFLGSNIVKISLEEFSLPRLFRGRSQARLIPKLRRIAIQLPLYEARYHNDYEFDFRIQKLQNLCQALATRPQLAEISIVPSNPNYWHYPDMSEAVKRILECFAILRSFSGRIFLLQGDIESNVFSILKGEIDSLVDSWALPKE